jgi:hypothetical protein
MMRPLFFLAALPCLCFRASATEWQDLTAQYQTVSVLGGLGQGNGPNNPNEWNNAEGLPATLAELSEPHSAMADIYGRVFVSDKNAHAVRRIDLDGTIHTVAGVNLGEIAGINSGFNGDGPARECLLNGPQNTYPLPDGSFYILDSLNMRIRRVDAAGNLTTVITDTAVLNRGLWVQRDGQVIYYCTNSQLKRWTPSQGNGPGVLVAGGFAETGNIDVDAAGNIFVSDRNLAGVYKIPPNYGGGLMTDAQRVAGLGNASTIDSNSTASGLPATQVGLVGVRGVAFHPLGGFFVATHRGGDVWYIDSAGIAWSFIQGNSGNTHVANPSSVPTLGDVMSEPRSVSVSLSGDVIVACNDAGFVRIARNVLPPPAPPVWDANTKLTEQGMDLRWQSVPGRWYFLERAAGLGASAWSPLAALPSAGDSTGFVDTGSPANVRSFYRVRSFRAWPN